MTMLLYCEMFGCFFFKYLNVGKVTSVVTDILCCYECVVFTLCVVCCAGAEGEGPTRKVPYSFLHVHRLWKPAEETSCAQSCQARQFGGTLNPALPIIVRISVHKYFQIKKKNLAKGTIQIANVPTVEFSKGLLALYTSVIKSTINIYWC